MKFGEYKLPPKGKVVILLSAFGQTLDLEDTIFPLTYKNKY